MPSDRGHEEEAPAEAPEEAEATWTSEVTPELQACGVFDELSTFNAEEPSVDSDAEAAEDESSEAEPEWMSFQTPDAGSLVANFEELWSRDHPHGTVGEAANLAGLSGEITAEAICQLVAERVQQEIARALEEAGHKPPRNFLRQQIDAATQRYRSSKKPEQNLLDPTGQATASGKPQELLRPISERLGNGVARAGAAMQDASRLAREAKAVVTSRANTRSQSVPRHPEVTPSSGNQSSAESDAPNTKTKVVDAANAMKAKLMTRIPKGFPQRQKKEVNLLSPRIGCPSSLISSSR